ncbi:TetR/AcrR family transcriptional regulator [Nocardioides terrisoli]|uniref:TetR/AcrR family transcriptional regulator n=1 Tax=Nocardioides terrisoli TaxID=3388267 RepID=UPI00287B81BB|nr:helix-turn-helix domain-containing protein [Nocardioides marmorisolisilvae]
MSTSRPYRSEHRRQQAEETRRRILAAARRLFAEAGYGATGVGDIASAAGVSVPTVYASVGTKAELARSLVEFINAEGGVYENDRLQRRATTAPELLRRNMHLVRELNQRCGDIMRAVRSAAHSEPDLVQVVAAGDGYHREGEYAIAARLAEMGALREGVDPERAGAIMTVMASSATIDQLVLEHGWSYDQVEDWLVETLTALLLR